MEKELRLGVIGAGSWAVAALLPALSPRSEDVELVGVCGSNFETLARIQDQFGFQMSSPDDREVLVQEVDITLVSSPPGLHHRQATAKRRPGAIVLKEKPMTITREKARDIVREAAKNPRKLLFSFVWTCMGAVKTAVGAVREPGVSHTVATAQISFGGSPEFSEASGHVEASGNKHELEARAIGSEHPFIGAAHRLIVWVFCPDQTDVTATLEANVVDRHLGARSVDALELVYPGAAAGHMVVK